MNTPDDLSSEELYRRAHSLHYDDQDFQRALELYHEVIARFPRSVEAEYARTQVENIDESQNPPPIGTGDLPWATVEEKLRGKFRCVKCGNGEVTFKRIATTGTGFSRLVDLQHNYYLSVTCTQCGFVEFYDLDTIEGKGGLRAWVDFFFGR